MRVSNNYRIVFDKHGEIFFSDAPFCKANTSKLIGDYLPLFAELDIFEQIINKPIHPYEFSVGKKKYLVDVRLDRLKKNEELFYDLSLKDRTPLYKDFQKERTEKNTFKKQNEELVEINKRLKLKLHELEEVIAFIVSDEIKVPIGNLKNSLIHIANEGVDHQKKNKILNLALGELETMESLFGALNEINHFACATSFEDAYYCSVGEILEDVAHQMSIQAKRIQFDAPEDERLFFVNKYHLSKIIQNTIQFFHQDASTQLERLWLEDKSKVEEIHQVTFQLNLEYSSSQRENDSSSLIVMSLNRKKNEMALKTASKIAQVYDGKIKILSNEWDKKTALITFDGLMSKSISHLKNHTDLGRAVL